MPATPPNPRRRRGLIAGLSLGGFSAAGLWLANAASAQTEGPVDDVVTQGNARIDLRFGSGFTAPQRALGKAWVQRSAACVADYMGAFPVPRSRVVLQAASGNGISGGTTYNAPPPTVRVRLGSGFEEKRLLNDWVMVHEMVHLAIPQFDDRHNWFHEGAATYAEIIARARAGLTTKDSAWVQLAQNLPRGLPEAGDRGLDFTDTWGRTYWGGALYFLLADVTLRRRSANKVGLPDAFAGLRAAGSSYAEHWPLERVIRTADSATGHTVLMDLYEGMKDQPVTPDLPQLWRELGVTTFGTFPKAPLVEVRRAITGEDAPRG